MGRSVDYVTLAVDVWLFMVLPTVYALTKSVLPISQGAPLLATVSRRRPRGPAWTCLSSSLRLFHKSEQTPTVLDSGQTLHSSKLQTD